MGGSKTLSLGGDMTVGGIALDYATADTANNLTINAGNTLTLNGGTLGGLGVGGANYTATGILLNRGTGGTLTINSAVTLGANQSWVSGRASGGFTVAGDVNLGAFTLTTNITSAATTGTSTISGAISGTAGGDVEAIKKLGNGVLVLSGNSSYSGVTTLGAGGAATSNILVLGNANALGTSTLAFRGGVLRSGVADLTVANNMNVAAGGVRLGGTNSFTLSGTLTMDASSRTVANYSSNGSTVTIGGITTVAGSTVAFDNAANAATGAPIIISGAITGVGNVSFSGSHNTTLAGVNTYTGTTTLSGGNLTLSGSTAAGSAFTMSGGTITGSGTVNGTMAISGGTIRLAGGATTTSLTFNQGVTFTNSPTVVFMTPTTGLTAYDVFGYGTGTVTGIANLKIGYRGTLTDDTVNKKYVFTTGEYGATRTWNTTTGTWDSLTTANFAEGDQKFFAGDNVVFGDIASDSVVTITGTLAPGSVTVGNSANMYTFQTGALTGGMSLTKNGAGTLKISSNQSYTGGTTVNGGKLILAGGGSSGTIRGTLTANTGTTIEIGGSDVLGYSTGADAVRIINLNNATLVQTQNRNETNTAVINMAGGSSITATGGTAALIDMFGGTAAINSTGDVTNLISAPLRLRQNDTAFTVADGASAVDLSISGVISKGGEGNGAIIKNGAGTMVLTGNNTYTGNTTINDGVLQVTGTGAHLYNGGYNGSAIITVNTGGTLRLDSFAYQGNGGTGQLADYAARRVINGGTIEVIGGAHSSGNNFNVGANGGTFRYNPTTTTDTLTLAGNGNSDISIGGALTIDAIGNVTVSEIITGTGSIAKTGSKTLTLNASNAYAGGTTLTTGTLKAGHANAFGTGSITVNGGTLDLGGFAIANATTINGGNLALGAGGTVTVSGTASVGSLTGSGAITGNVAATNVSVGNSPGLITVTGDLAASGTTTMEIWGTTAATGPSGDGFFDKLVVTGGLDVTGGTLDLQIGGTTYTPIAGDTFDLFDFGTITGTFATINATNISGGGLAWDYSNLYTTGTVGIVAVPEPSSFACVMGLAVLGAVCTRRRRRD